MLLRSPRAQCEGVIFFCSLCCATAVPMSLRRYLKLKGGLPDPRGPLSASMSPAAIASANREVEMAKKTPAKRGTYKK